MTLVIGISLVLLLPTVQLLPATTRAWRSAMILLRAVHRQARTARKLLVIALTGLLLRRVPITEDIVSLYCAQLC